MLVLSSFLTAYDPSDLPGSSVDPLGFDRGYLLLAGKFLPGLTNVANKPRYFSLLCAAIAVYDRHVASVGSPRERYEGRLAAIQRAERFWTLASVRASADANLDLGGIRGIRYVQRAAARIDEQKATSTAADFRLLSRQMSYGIVGIYGSVADDLKLIDRKSFSLGPDLGRRLGEAFVSGTSMPNVLSQAIASGGSVGLNALTDWGRRAHPNVKPEIDEALVLHEALVAHPTRARASKLLQAHAPADREHELVRLERVLKSMASTDEDADLREALRTIVAFERCFRLVLMGFQRLLWQCQREEPFAVVLSATAEDAALVRLHEQLPAAFDKLDRALLEGQTRDFRAGLERIGDARGFLHGAAQARDVPELIERILARHRDVQQAKRDGGRPKMPWLEIRGSKIVPTLSTAMQVNRPPSTLDDVLAHPYRTGAVDQFLALGASR